VKKFISLYKKNRESRDVFKKYSIPFYIITTVLILIPTLLMIFYAFIEPNNKGTIFSFTILNLAKFFTNSSYIKVFGVTLYLALLATFICFVIGFPIAYLFSFRFTKKTSLLIIFTMPIWLNSLLRTLSIKIILTLINPNLVGTIFAMELGMIFLFLPFMILSIYNTMSKIDKNLLEASQDLGANKLHTTLRIVFPLSLPGVMNGVMLVFLPALTSLIIPQYLGGGKEILIAKIIETFFINGGNLPVGAAISFVISIFVVIILGISYIVDKKYNTQNKKKKKKRVMYD